MTIQRLRGTRPEVTDGFLIIMQRRLRGGGDGDKKSRIVAAWRRLGRNPVTVVNKLIGGKQLLLVAQYLRQAARVLIERIAMSSQALDRLG